MEDERIIFVAVIPKEVKEKANFREHCRAMINEISRIESLLDKLSFMTEELEGWGNFYPLSCLEKMQIMRVVLEDQMKR